MVHAVAINLTYMFHELCKKQKNTHHIFPMLFTLQVRKNLVLKGKDTTLVTLHWSIFMESHIQNWWMYIVPRRKHCSNVWVQILLMQEDTLASPWPGSPFCFSKILSPAAVTLLDEIWIRICKFRRSTGMIWNWMRMVWHGDDLEYVQCTFQGREHWNLIE